MMMSTLVWTKKKPTLSGFYFFRMLDTAWSVQLPHVRRLDLDDGELCVIEPDFAVVNELSEDFEYAGPIIVPVEYVENSDPFERNLESFDLKLPDSASTEEQLQSLQEQINTAKLSRILLICGALRGFYVRLMMLIRLFMPMG